MNKRILALLLVVGLAVAVLAGCNSSPKGTGPKIQGEIVYGLTGDPVMFNPILTTDTVSSFFELRIYEGLVRANEKLELEPYLAKEYSYNEDGTILTFKLHEGVKWHDGKPFTAHDVKFTYDTCMSPDYTGVRRSNFTSVDKIEVVNDHEVKIYMKEVDASFISKLTIGIIPKHIYGDYEIAKLREHPANLEPIGTGPYKFGEWRKGEYLVLNANPDYRSGPYIERVRVKFVQDNQVLLAELEAGTIDYMAAIPVDDIARIKRDYANKYNFAELATMGYNYFGIMADHPIFGDITMRQALMYGLNRQQIAQTVYKGYATVLNSNIAPASWAFGGDKLNSYAYDKAKAIELLTNAGWGTVGADGIRVKDGKRLTLQVLTATGNVQSEAVLSIAKEQWKEIGVDADIQYYEWSVLVDKYLDVGNFEGYYLGWNTGLDPDCLIFFHSSMGFDEEGILNGFNDVNYANERVDELLEQGRTTVDQSARKQIYIEIQEHLNRDLPNLFTFTQNTVAAMNKKFQGITWSPLGPIFPEQWYIADQSK